jgi:hypothetical protein
MRRGRRTLVARMARLFLDVGQTSDRHDEPAPAPYPEALGDLKKGSFRCASPCDHRAEPVGQALQMAILYGPRGFHQVEHADFDATIDLAEDGAAGLHGAHACLHPVFARWSGRMLSNMILRTSASLPLQRDCRPGRELRLADLQLFSDHSGKPPQIIRLFSPKTRQHGAPNEPCRENLHPSMALPSDTG